MPRDTQPMGRGHRREQLAAELRRVLQDAITRGLSDPRVVGIITITEVQVSSDLAAATIKVSVMPEKNQNKVIAGLKHAARHMRHEAGEKITSVRIPDLFFELDLSLKKQAAVITALAAVSAEREEPLPISPWRVDHRARPANNPAPPAPARVFRPTGSPTSGPDPAAVAKSELAKSESAKSGSAKGRPGKPARGSKPAPGSSKPAFRKAPSNPSKKRKP